MPKKGKGKGKGKGKKKGSAKKKPSKAATVAEQDKPVDEVTRLFYLNQIKSLDERVVRYRERNDVLEVRNKDLEERLQTEQRDKFDITITLKRQLGEMSDAQSEIMEQISEMRGKHGVEKDGYEQQIASLKTHLKEQRSQLQNELARLQAELKTLEEFRRMKDDLEARTRRREVELETVKGEYKQYKGDKEKEIVIRQQRLKQEMAAKVEATAAEYHKISDQRMLETTRRTIQENEIVNENLTTMTSNASDYMGKSKKLQNRCTELSRELDILKTTHQAVLEKKVSNDKIIHVLLMSVQEQEDAVQKVTEVKETVCALEDRLEKTMDERLSFEQKCKKSVARLEWLEKTLKSCQGENEFLKSKNADAKRIFSRLGSILMQRIQGPKLSDTDPQARTDAVSAMLDILRVAGESDLMSAPTPQQQMDQRPQQRSPTTPWTVRETPTAGSAGRATGTLPPIVPLSKPSLTSRGRRIVAPPTPYMPGFMGITPSTEPVPAISTIASAAQTGGDETRQAAVAARPLSVAVGVQTVSIPRALLLADRLLGERGDGGTAAEEKGTPSRTSLTESDFYLQTEMSRHEQSLVDAIKRSTRVQGT